MIVPRDGARGRRQGQRRAQPAFALSRALLRRLCARSGPKQCRGGLPLARV